MYAKVDAREKKAEMLGVRNPFETRPGSYFVKRIFSVFVHGAIVAGVLATSADALAQAKPAAEKPAEPPPLPPASARLWLIAPTALGPWTLRVENEGSVPLRIPADGRLLRLEVQADESAKPVSCILPKSLRSSSFPQDRELLLAAGHSYEESFDPRLYCFGKNAAVLGPNAIVRARFGWELPKVPKWKPKTTKPPTGPFAVESTEREPTIAPLWELQAPAILLGSIMPTTVKEWNPAATMADLEPAPEKKEPAVQSTVPAAPPLPPVDERAGKLELSSSGFVDASAPRTITLSVTTKNVGLRPIVVALRPWMLSFRIDGPGDESEMCYADHADRNLPRDAYRPLAPGASTSFSVLLAEVCPKNTFSRPGLYRVTPMMAAKETTNGIDIQTNQLTTREPSFIRLTSADEPFYEEPPKAVAPPVANAVSE